MSISGAEAWGGGMIEAQTTASNYIRLLRAVREGRQIHLLLRWRRQPIARARHGRRGRGQVENCALALRGRDELRPWYSADVEAIAGDWHCANDALTGVSPRPSRQLIDLLVFIHRHKLNMRASVQNCDARIILDRELRARCRGVEVCKRRVEGGVGRIAFGVIAPCRTSHILRTSF